MKVRDCLWATICALALCVPATWAQQTDPRVNPPVAPKPPLSVDESSSKAPEESAITPSPEPNQATPDTRPLSGIEQFTLGQMGKRRSYLLSSLQFLETADTNSNITSGQSNLDAVSTLFGHITLQRVWSRYELAADYSGGGYLYNTRSGLNSAIHQFGVTQRIAWRRWSLLLSDQVGYLPEASFGFGGLNYYGLGGSVTNLTNVNPIFEPNQTILTARATRISNTVVGEVAYTIGPKSSITASGSYGILRFTGTGSSLIDSSNEVFLTGYNYALTHRDTIALTYGLSLFRFEGTNQRFQNHSVHVAYGRRITGRFALQLSAGPEIATFSNPGTRLSWGMGSFLLYQFRRTSLGISYSNYLSGGSGVLVGAQSHSIGMTVGRQLSRRWSGSLDFGFARNTALHENTAQAANPAFYAGYAGVTLSRPLGRYMGVSINYYLQRQSSNTGPCTVTICGTVPLRHHFGLGFNWHHRPILID